MGRQSGTESTMIISTTTERGAHLVKPNYQSERRQKDIAKKKKNEEKRLRKLEKKNHPSTEALSAEHVSEVPPKDSD